MWRIIESGQLPPANIMAKDQLLLNELEHDPASPTLHFYDWEGQCLTYGYFTKPQELLNMNGINKYNLKMARRPTGGGIIFHLTDLAFSVIIPAGHHGYSQNTLDNYAYINQGVAKVISEWSGKQMPILLSEDFCNKDKCIPFCMAQPTRYDVVVNGKKVGGAAQRKTKWGYLHQGTISLALPPIHILKAVLKSEIIEAMQANTYSLLPPDYTPAMLTDLRQQVKHRLRDIIALFLA